MNNPESAKNLLALDSGGIRGASMLIVLGELMRRLEYEMGNDKDMYMVYGELRPCEVFDMIGGSGMGGIIAILLGILGMNVRNAIWAYTKISEHLYKNGYSRETTGKKLEEALQNVLMKCGFPQDSRMMDHEWKGKGCKTFVVANTTQNGANPVLFRGYRPRKNPSANCYIWEAARATTANRQLFPDITISSEDGVAVPYVGTEYRGNNPTQYVIDEFNSEFPGKKIASVISIGAGHPGPITLPKQTPNRGCLSWWGDYAQPETTEDSTVMQGLTKTLQNIAKDCEETADRMEGKYIGMELDIGFNPYTRLNVEQGMHELPISEMDLPETVRAHTISYLQQPRVGRDVDQTLKKMEPRVREKAEKASSCYNKMARVTTVYSDCLSSSAM